MRICVIGLRGIPDVMGGIEMHCQHLYPRLARLDPRLYIVVIGRSGYVRRGRVGDVCVVPLWAPRGKGVETLIHTPLAILYARLFLHPQVIHLHGIGPGFFAPLARLLGFRVISTHHAKDYDRAKWGRFGRWFLRAGELMVARFANDVICVSSAIEAALSLRHPQGSRRYVTIRNGAPPATARSGDDRVLHSLGLTPRSYVLAVGRIDPAKGFGDLVRAFDLARPPGLRLVIAGGSLADDAYTARLKQSASKNVVFAGVQPTTQLSTLYQNAALFVHPSHSEGFPMVVLEALAADAPILVSDIPAHREIGLEEASFFKVSDVDGLAAQLGKGKFDRLRCRRRLDILRENDWDAVARRHHEIMFRRLRGGLEVAVAASDAHLTGP
jgi:glycosyltransferase involved in cell wall biosynthesis